MCIGKQVYFCASIVMVLASAHNKNNPFLQFLFITNNVFLFLVITLRAKLSGVTGPVCVFVFVCGFVCLWVCYHDNSKLRASILTKLGL